MSNLWAVKKPSGDVYVVVENDACVIEPTLEASWLGIGGMIPMRAKTKCIKEGWDMQLLGKRPDPNEAYAAATFHASGGHAGYGGGPAGDVWEADFRTGRLTLLRPPERPMTATEVRMREAEAGKALKAAREKLMQPLMNSLYKKILGS